MSRWYTPLPFITIKAQQPVTDQPRSQPSTAWDTFAQRHNCFEPGQDVFCLNGGNDACVRSSLPDNAINQYARDLRTYKNGTVVTKHLAPWGNASTLYDDSFVLVKKVFLYDGSVMEIHVKSQQNGQEYVLNDTFFPGWIDLYTLNAHYNYFV